MNKRLEKMLKAYKEGDGSAGIPNELRIYAQAHPEELIDRSGNNIGPDSAWFRFHNPDPRQGDVEGVNWFPNDDRNNPSLTPPTDKEDAE